MYRPEMTLYEARRKVEFDNTTKIYIYGFPLSDKEFKDYSDKFDYPPMPSDLKSYQIECYKVGRADAALSDLQDRLSEVYGTYIQVAGGFSQKRGETTVFTLAVSTKRKKKLIPAPDMMKKLSEVLASEGFTWEPEWLLLIP